MTKLKRYKKDKYYFNFLIDKRNRVALLFKKSRASIMDLLEKIKKNNLRKTKLRLYLVKILSESNKPLDIQELLKLLLKNKIKVHKTSVYRQLIVLKREKIIEEVNFFENKKRYKAYSEKHHHHLICTNCGSVEELVNDKEIYLLEKKIYQKNRFKVVKHFLEFFGLCSCCYINLKRIKR